VVVRNCSNSERHSKKATIATEAKQSQLQQLRAFPVPKQENHSLNLNRGLKFEIAKNQTGLIIVLVSQLG